MIAQFSVAGTPEEACRVMTAKLAASAQLSYWDMFTNSGWSPLIHEGNTMKKAESVVEDAYKMRAKELNAKWPGFFEWSTAEVLKAWRYNWTPDELKQQGFLDCLARYSSYGAGS